jgi:hypothetical protein
MRSPPRAARPHRRARGARAPHKRDDLLATMAQAYGTSCASFSGVIRAVSGSIHLLEGRACQIRHAKQYTGWWRG